MQRTRIKICGITRPEDLRSAVSEGADALGFVFYPKSPRYVAPEQFALLSREVPPYVSSVALFVNPTVEEVEAVV
ncbi:MAG: phosphoribosylanthranilate isomerase, partial [Telluria sp.]